MKIYIRLEAPFEWVRVDGTRVDAFGEVASLEDYPLDKDSEVIGVVPGEWVTTHQVQLPAKSRKQFQAAVPYALEESISEDVDQLHFVCPQWKVGEACTVLVVASDKMRYWQALANEHKLPVLRLLPDHALVPLHDGAEFSLSQNDGQIFTNSRSGYGVTLDEEFLDVWMMDVPMSATIAVSNEQLTEQLIASHPDRDFRHWSFGSRMAHWLEYPQASSFDLWSDQYRPKVTNLNWQSYGLPVLMIVAAMVVKLGFDTYRYFALHSEVRSINEQMQQVLTDTFPEIDSVEVDTEHQVMERALIRRGGVLVSNGIHAMLAETSAVLRKERVTLANIVFRDEELIITCQLNDFSQVDKITRQLNRQPKLIATLQSSAADDGEILASYSVKQG